MAKARIGGDVRIALGLAAALILLATLIDEGAFGIAATLLILPLIVYAMCRVPIRYSMMTLLFLVLVLPNPAEGVPTAWLPPFLGLGSVLLNRVNTVLRDMKAFDVVWVSGLDVLFIVLGIIIHYRKSTGATIDGVNRLVTPKPLVRLAWLSLATATFTWLSGLVRGGDFRYSLWQMSVVIYLPIIFLLFQAGLRGPQDHPALARTVVCAALYKAALALYVVNTQVVPKDPYTGNTTPVYATSHADSVLFSVAVVLLLVGVLERVHKKAKWYALLILPIVLGVRANNRRLAWAEIGLALITIYIVSRETPLKRKLRRGLLALTPLFAVYAAAGWSSQYGGFFKPVRLIRSMTQPATDASSLWRELENLNIIVTFQRHTLFGTGFGHPYEQVVILPAVDYSLELYAPHNSLLGLWCYTGLVGFAGLTLLWGGGVYFAMRGHHHSNSTPTERAAALLVVGCVLIYMMQAWGDIGLGNWNGAFLMGAALAVAGKLGAVSGEWSTKLPHAQSAAAAQPDRGFARPPHRT